MNVRTWQWTGWAFFSISAIAFIISAWRAGDMVALTGAVAFMVANGAFMVAHSRDGGAL